MSVFINEHTSIVVQGMTGNEGSFWSRHMIQMGSTVVAGVTPGKEGQTVEGCPVFHTMRRVVERYPVDASVIFVPPQFTKDAVYEALDSGIKKIVTIADGIPLHDMLQIRAAAKSEHAFVIGGNTTGVISPR
jgi:succinyl-CoA synthetase alpha subunit